MAIIIIILLVLSLIPILYISHFSFPTADDYDYSIATHNAWIQSHSLFNVIKASISSSMQMYHDWQGTIAAMVIMGLHTGIFNENLYFIGTYITVFLFILGNLFIGKVILRDYLKASKSIWLIITIPVIMASMQFLPSPVQAFYWWNGGFYYTGFYALELILFGFILKYLKKDEDSKKWRLIIPIWLLSALIASSNFTTSANVVLMLLIFTIIGFICNKLKGKFLIIATTLASISLLISVTAPGNAVRQALTQKMGLIDAINNSFVYAFRFIGSWTTLPVILILLFVSIVLIGLLKNIKWQFKYPILVTLFTFGIFASLLTPPFYATSETGANRLVNLLYYVYYWLMLINIFYYVGWARNIIKECFKNKADYEKTELKVGDAFKKKTLFASILIAILFVISILNGDNQKYTSFSAYRSLRNGEAEIYHTELQKRLQLYNNKDIKNVVVDELSVKPYVLYFDDITTDINDWRNRSVATYYHKESVRLKTTSDLNN